MRKFKSLLNVLRTVYPEHLWDDKIYKSKIARVSKRQHYLLKCTKELFPQYEFHVNYRHPELTYRDTGTKMEIDIFIPGLSLGLECQGQFHYNKSESFVGAAQLSLKDRDDEKKEACKRVGITLVEVPHWWDEDKDSLAATIHMKRPDLIAKPSNALPIPETEPKENMRGRKRLRDKIARPNLQRKKVQPPSSVSQ